MLQQQSKQHVSYAERIIDVIKFAIKDKNIDFREFDTVKKNIDAQIQKFEIDNRKNVSRHQILDSITIHWEKDSHNVFKPFYDPKELDELLKKL